MSERQRRRAAKAQGQVSEILSAATTPETKVTEPMDKPKSIRSLIMSAILAGKPTKEIAAEVQAHFPGTAAATKSTKHIAWYRSRMKKDGLFTPKAETVVDAATAS